MVVTRRCYGHDVNQVLFEAQIGFVRNPVGIRVQSGKKTIDFVLNHNFCPRYGRDKNNGSVLRDFHQLLSLPLAGIWTNDHTTALDEAPLVPGVANLSSGET